MEFKDQDIFGVFSNNNKGSNKLSLVAEGSAVNKGTEDFISIEPGVTKKVK